jgi:flagellar FliJ protein
MGFSFPLQTLLNWKRNLEEFSQIRLAEKIARLKNQEEEIKKLTRKRISYDEELKEKSLPGIRADEYSFYKEFAEESWRDLLNKESKKKDSIKEVEVERERMIFLSKEKKILEKLKEKKLKNLLAQWEKLEQKGNDELVTMKYHLRSK